MLNIDLTGRIALVTGATGELGRVMCRTLAHAGADIALHYHRASEQARVLASELRGMGRRVAEVQADVCAPDRLDAFAAAVREQLGEPDIVVVNAVIQYEWKPVLEQPLSDYESQFRSSVAQSVLLAQAFVPSMIERGWGRVIGISSECAMQCMPRQSAYAAGKRGMDGVLRTLAREVGPGGVTVNQVAPGWTLSENRAEQGTPQWYYDAVALGRRGTDQEIANVVAFLASDQASFVTGAYVPACGGNVMPAI